MKKKVILVSALLASLVSSGVMADQASDIQEAKTKAEQALNKANEVDGKVSATDGKVNNMVTTLDQYKEKTDKLEKDLKDYDTVKTNAANAVQNKKDITDLTQKVADAEKNLNTQAAAFRQVGQGVDQKAKEAKQKAEEAEKKVTTLEGNVKTVSGKADSAANRVGDLEAKLHEYDTVKENAAKAAQHEAKINELTGKVSAAEQKANKVGELETKLQDYDQVKEKANKVEALDQKIDNTKTDLEATIRTVDEKVTKLGNPEARIKEVEKTFGDKLASMEGYTNKGLAKVTALSGLHPLGYDAASKWNISVATGHYKSENAIAMGAFFRPNRHVLLSFAGTVSGGDDAYTFGASIRVGRSGHKEMSGASEGMISATEFYDIVGRLQDEIARQKQEIEALKNR